MKKPKLVLGPKGSGKTARILETVKWLDAVIICPDMKQRKFISDIIAGDPGYDDVAVIPCNMLHHLGGHKDVDIICVDNFDTCININPNIMSDISTFDRVPPVLTQTLDTERFDVKIMGKI